MKKILVLVLLIFAFGCSNDTTAPSENTIVGKWMRFYDYEQDDEDIIMVIEFTSDGVYIVKDGEELEGDDLVRGNYTYINNVLTMKDDNCDDMEGKYELVFRNNGVEFKLKEDECDRNKYMPGFFDKYKETLYNK